MELTAKVPPVKQVNIPGKVINLQEGVDKLIADEVHLLTREDNKFWSSPDRKRNEYLHSFFQYPAMMVPIVQKKLIEIIVRHKPAVKNVLDPYMGSGTSLVACMENGLHCFGQDVNPLALLVSQTKTGPYYIDAIKIRQNLFRKIIEKDSSKKIESNFNGLNKWFTKLVQIELSKIVRAIKKEKRKAIRRFYWVVLAETVRLSSNDRTSTFKLHIRPEEEINKRNISPIYLFYEHFNKCIKDLEWYSDLLKKAKKISKGAYVGKIQLHLKDSKKSIYLPRNKKTFFDLLVTSPPYGDNKTTVTYGQHAYLPLQWINLSDISNLATNDCLKSTLEIDSRGLGGVIKKLEPEQLSLLYAASPSFKKVYQELRLKDKLKAPKVASFIYDLYLSIRNIHTSLKLNAYQIWTIGNRNVAGIEIPNNLILTELVKSEGAVLVAQIEREILNKRMAKRNKDSNLMTFEDILIFRKIG